MEKQASSHLMASPLQRSRPGHLLREALRVRYMVVYRKETKAPKGCGELGVLCVFCASQPP